MSTKQENFEDLRKIPRLLKNLLPLRIYQIRKFFSLGLAKMYWWLDMYVKWKNTFSGRMVLILVLNV